VRILLTNATLSGRSGTETVTRDLALGHLRKGRHPTIYIRRTGPIAQELMAAGVPVVDNVDALSGAFDIVHGHHLAVCAGALALLPRTPAISVSHDATVWHDLPVFAPTVGAYAGISQIIVDRLVQNGVPRERAHLVNNGIDLERFRPGPPPPAKPRRALAFAKNVEHVAGVREACAARGIDVDFIGSAVGNLIDAPEQAIPSYDLIFSSAQSAQESLVCQRPVIAVDGRGLAGMIDMARYEAWRPHNFGLAAFNQRPTAENILAELDRYDPAEAVRVGARARAELGIDHTLDAYVTLYERAASQAAQPPEEAARAWARHLEQWSPRLTAEWPWLREHARLVFAADVAAAGVALAPLDTPLRFDKTGTAAPYVALIGFSRAEPWGVWSPQPSATIRLRTPPATQGLQLDLAYSFLAGAAGAPMEIEVLAHGEPLARWTEAGQAHWAPYQRILALPPALCGQMLWLSFRISHAGGASGPRHPGLALNAITLRAA
jgi:hypothetical protein